MAVLDFIVRHRRLLVIALVLALSLALVLTELNRMSTLSETLTAQRMAYRWAGSSTERFAQVSGFIPSSANITEEPIFALRQTITRRLAEVSLEPAEGASLWIDAYSATAKLRVTGNRAGADVTAIGVGGNYFKFHPLRLRSGSYFAADDLMQDRVVIDYELAWRIFGAHDVAGMSVQIGSEEFIVAGVVEREQDFASKLAYPLDGGLYLPLEALRRLAQGDVSITCYELVMPDPISGFAESIVRDNLKIDGIEVVENSSRFKLSAIFELLRGLDRRVMRQREVAYPYWENAARVIEVHMAQALLLAIIGAVLPAIALLIALRIALRALRRRINLRRTFERAQDFVNRRVRRRSRNTRRKAQRK